jgi:hypothetical protein
MNLKIYHDTNTNRDSTVSYKGSSIIENAAWFCPYIPLESSTLPWEELLDTLHVNHSLDPSRHQTPQDHIMDAIAIMQERWPRPYVVEETYDTKGMKFVYTMVFNSKEDKALFILTHSGS